MTNASTFCEESSRATLSPILRRTITDDVLDALRRSIVSGAFAPGHHLAEGTLAQQLNVSRAPVREAMMTLEREGLLVFNKRGAAMVKAFTMEDFDEIVSLRLTLETMAARLACRRMTEADVTQLQANIESTRTAKKIWEMTLLDVQFHDLIMQSARHTRLYASWSNLRPQIEVWLARMHNLMEEAAQKTREITVKQHQRLLTILRSGDESKAESTIREQIEDWQRRVPDGRALVANKSN